MSLNSLLKLQVLYAILGILFNLFSWYLRSSNGVSLTPTAPLSGILAMSIYGLFLLSGKFQKINLYRILMLIAIIIFGYGGIIKHVLLLNQNPEIYYSTSAGIIAILINAFGLVLNVMAVFHMFSVKKQD